MYSKYYVVQAHKKFLAHITRFLEVRHSWVPGTQMITGFLSPFCLSLQMFLLRTSVGKTRIIPFLGLSLNWKFPAWYKPPLSQRSTARDWNRERISNLANKVDCGLSKRQLPDAFSSALCTWLHSSWFLTLHQIDSVDLPCYKNLHSGLLEEPCHMARVTKSVPKNVILQSALLPKCMEVQWVWCKWVGADCLSPSSCGRLVLESSWGFCSWQQVRTESACWDAWGTLEWLLQKCDR